ncbi:hypothetical protein HanXRQr2_Chr15g0695351 [Helianthus annuus]|uniref:Uncharacterized protein n=1 Tax=Helianthus annuus TaxID=4232 RepID=A0A9K3E2B8_HELAN|nr:hypothetical protein HanXRQr2_Chr15g0695351 [Helianthus annuus]KAJ0831461.1 hypothetical protein HanPSC8_Chr15g0667321 [Helianthus annuus]
MTPEAATPVFVTLSMRMYQRLSYPRWLIVTANMFLIIHVIGGYQVPSVIKWCEGLSFFQIVFGDTSSHYALYMTWTSKLFSSWECLDGGKLQIYHLK